MCPQLCDLCATPGPSSPAPGHHRQGHRSPGAAGVQAAYRQKGGGGPTQSRWSSSKHLKVQLIICSEYCISLLESNKPFLYERSFDKNLNVLYKSDMQNFLNIVNLKVIFSIYLLIRAH